MGRHRRAGLRRQPTSPTPLRTPPSSEPLNMLTCVMYKCGLEICLGEAPLNFILHPGLRKQRGALQGRSGGTGPDRGRCSARGWSEQTRTGCLGTGRSKEAARCRQWESSPWTLQNASSSLTATATKYPKEHATVTVRRATTATTAKLHNGNFHNVESAPGRVAPAFNLPGESRIPEPATACAERPVHSTHSLNAPGNQWTNSSEAHGRDPGLGQARAHSVSQRSAPGTARRAEAGRGSRTSGLCPTAPPEFLRPAASARKLAAL